MIPMDETSLSFMNSYLILQGYSDIDHGVRRNQTVGLIPQLVSFSFPLFLFLFSRPFLHILLSLTVYLLPSSLCSLSLLLSPFLFSLSSFSFHLFFMLFHPPIPISHFRCSSLYPHLSTSHSFSLFLLLIQCLRLSLSPLYLSHLNHSLFIPFKTSSFSPFSFLALSVLLPLYLSLPYLHFSIPTSLPHPLLSFSLHLPLLLSLFAFVSMQKLV